MSVILLTSIIPNISQLVPQLIAQYGNLIYVGLFIVILIETGVVVLPFLPGDSLLFLCGSLAAVGQHSLNVWFLFGLLSVAAAVGDAMNFEIGQHFGQYLATSERWQRLIKPKYLQQSATFFDRHGKGAIFLGRFVPIVRTFIPFTAGISHMHYRDFAIYNILGAVSWVGIAVGAGYFFGNIPLIKAHFELIMLAIVAISLIPVLIVGLRSRKGQTDAE